MSSNTKIIVLKSKELIYTGIFIVFGILLVLLLFYMFSPSSDKNSDKKDSTEINSSPVEGTEEVKETINTYKSGLYTSELSLGGSKLTCSVTVNDGKVNHVDIQNLDDTITAMYPLIGPSLDEINAQIAVSPDIDSITYSKDNQYTTIIILEAVKQALSAASE